MVESGSPYFVTEAGQSWTPIGQNDAITWPELNGLFRRKDMGGVEEHLWRLRASGVTCLRLMLEYCQGQHRYIERPVGRMQANMVQLWDDLFRLLEKVGLHVLLTPYDTFFMWIRWRHHPYARQNGGPSRGRRTWLTCAATREAILARLAFASDRWGGSPALFAWDLWNEIHPAHAEDDTSAIAPFIAEVGGWLRDYEMRRHGRSHLQTVSIFGPELINHPSLAEPIFRHPSLDFATTHLYEFGTIDDPRDTVDPAIAAGRLMASAVSEAGLRPVLDTEHGPIHSFKDRKRTLPAAFDDEYFRHIQWAHIASGGAGGGMRWPNRHPHVLTPGMRHAQRVLSELLSRIDWRRFHRRNLSAQIRLSDRQVRAVGCGDGDQALLWLVRTDSIGPSGTLRRDVPPRAVSVILPPMSSNRSAIAYETTTGANVGTLTVSRDSAGQLIVAVPALSTDLAIVISPFTRK
ncbi:mannan endo-1,4-beta-mannosidase [Sphingomonas zeicaulis]|uniref:hypothetical protein n=1 Tax=Sphingomonas zeicaulis TaxID=1632740 RepID=UPI003D228B08